MPPKSSYFFQQWLVASVLTETTCARCSRRLGQEATLDNPGWFQGLNVSNLSNAPIVTSLIGLMDLLKSVFTLILNLIGTVALEMKGFYLFHDYIKLSGLGNPGKITEEVVYSKANCKYSTYLSKLFREVICFSEASSVAGIGRVVEIQSDVN
ncbi:hypothetical protein Tco_0785519 [Tanacetum coccineum]